MAGKLPWKHYHFTGQTMNDRNWVHYSMVSLYPLHAISSWLEAWDSATTLSRVGLLDKLLEQGEPKPQRVDWIWTVDSGWKLTLMIRSQCRIFLSDLAPGVVGDHSPPLNLDRRWGSSDSPVWHGGHLLLLDMISYTALMRLYDFGDSGNLGSRSYSLHTVLPRRHPLVIAGADTFAHREMEDGTRRYKVLNTGV